MKSLFSSSRLVWGGSESGRVEPASTFLQNPARGVAPLYALLHLFHHQHHHVDHNLTPALDLSANINVKLCNCGSGGDWDGEVAKTIKALSDLDRSSLYVRAILLFDDMMIII